MKNKYTLPVMLLVFTCLFACKKESSNIEASKEDIEVKDGYLTFKNSEAFKNTMDIILKKPERELSQWNQSINFTNSLRSSYEQDSILASDRLIPDPYFASVVNKQGMFAIGDTLHRITENYEYALKNGENTLNTLLSIQSSDEAQSIQGIKIHRVTGIKESKSGNSVSFTGKQSRYYEQCNDGRPNRVELAVMTRNYLVYQFARVEADGEAYRRGGVFGSRNWHPEEMYYTTITGTIDLKLANGLTQNDVPVNVSGYNQQSVGQTLDYYVGTPGNLNIHEIVRADLQYGIQMKVQCPRNIYNEVFQ